MKWYQLEAQAALEKLASTEHGLSEAEVRERLATYGPNKFVEEEKISALKILVHQFASPLIYILILAAGVTFFLEEYKDAVVIAAVVLFNALIGFVQEIKAEKSVKALKSMVAPKARVLREGKEKEIPALELVPGDIVLLESGTKVPADLRLLQTVELRIDEAILTGESLPVEKSARAIGEENLTPGDQRNMAFLGTIVLVGRAKGVVAETGPNTLLGSIAAEVHRLKPVKSPLQRKFDRFANLLGLIILGASIILFGVGVWMGEAPRDMFMTVVAAAVATIPEGLPIVVTITLARSVGLMARRNAIMRKLPAVETLGSTTVICSDKTGTLTKNEMTVKYIYDGEHIFEITGTGYDPRGEVMQSWMPVEPIAKGNLDQVLRIGLLCNESSVYEEEGEYKISGDPTEAALIVAARKAGLNLDEESAAYPRLDLLPFESERGYMATLHEHEGRKWLFVKGAPEKAVHFCTECMFGNGQKMHAIFKVADNMAREGLRVLAMAFREVPSDVTEITHQMVEQELIVAGVQGMIDPPREEVIDAIAGCQRAGIRVIMITGDHAVTAKAISRQLGLTREEPKVVTGKELEEMDDDQLFAQVQTTSVFARVAPEHKLRITQQLINHGEIVAVTGDGVNDTPALKAAHIGVAMGRTGTDVAKEAADMVIADDNFASIFAAVKEGRIVFDNIRKVVFFLMPTGIAAILSIIAAVALGMPMPYLPAQLLWINLVTNGLQVIALAFEPGEKDVDRRPPRDPNEGIMSAVLIQRTIIVGMLIALGVIAKFYYSFTFEQVSLDKARTLAVTTMVFFQFFQAWNSRSEYRSIFTLSPFSNPFLLYALLAATFAQLAVIYVPTLQWLFRTEILEWEDWAIVLTVSASVIVVVEIDKLLRRRKGRGQ
ncbi:MAG: HAD-IC family P-type ATPase [Deltaproteobacteria bacterium]|nr:HAD-IC family P-type ATPase [Deltaproteobacteria bacterium]